MPDDAVANPGEAPNTRSHFLSPYRASLLLGSVVLPYMIVTEATPYLKSHGGAKPFGPPHCWALLLALSVLLALMGLSAWAQATWLAEPDKPYYTKKTNSIYGSTSDLWPENNVRNRVCTLAAGPVAIITSAFTLRGTGQFIVDFVAFASTLATTISIYAWAGNYAMFLKSQLTDYEPLVKPKGRRSGVSAPEPSA